MAHVTRPSDLGAGLDPLIGLLSEAGFVAAEEEARELSERAAGDLELLDALVRHRLTGEPLAWITGRASFCGIEIRVDPGVYVPRWQSEPLARRAVERLPAAGTAIDLCTGSGAIAKVLSIQQPEALVLATDLDQLAVACATANGVAVLAATCSIRCRAHSKESSTLWSASCRTCRPPSWPSYRTTPWPSNRRCPTTVAPTACPYSVASRPGPVAFSGPGGTPARTGR